MNENNKADLDQDSKSEQEASSELKITNMCGTCDALDLPPPCRGHGGGEDSEEEQDQKITFGTTPHELKSHIDSILLDEKKYWKQAQLKWLDPDALIFDKSKSLLTIQIEPNNRILTFKSKPGLTKEEEELLRNLFNSIRTEFNNFKNELEKKGESIDNFIMANQDNTLTIKIPDEKYFHQFFMRLADKNLLPTKTNMLPQQKKETHEMDTETKQEIKHTAATPFDSILKGPQPKGVKRQD